MGSIRNLVIAGCSLGLIAIAGAAQAQTLPPIQGLSAAARSTLQNDLTSDSSTLAADVQVIARQNPALAAAIVGALAQVAPISELAAIAGSAASGAPSQAVQIALLAAQGVEGRTDVAPGAMPSLVGNIGNQVARTVSTDPSTVASVAAAIAVTLPAGQQQAVLNQITSVNPSSQQFVQVALVQQAQLLTQKTAAVRPGNPALPSIVPSANGPTPVNPNQQSGGAPPNKPCGVSIGCT